MTTLLAANDGGHLMQLHQLMPRLALDADRVWVAPRTAQSASLLRDEEVFWVERAPTRDAGAAARNALKVRRLLGRRRSRITAAYSTGSSLAVSVLPQARAKGVDAYYIESATRVDGPSLSGRILSRIPGVHLYTQCSTWATGRWAFGGSVLDGFNAIEVPEAPEVRRIVVSLGTSRRYGFRPLVERLVQIVPDGIEVLWQVGETDVSGLPITARNHIPAAEFEQAIAAADVVVAHAGTGVALTSLQAGKLPVLVPRRAGQGEHVDDHQAQIGRQLSSTGLAVVREVGDLAWTDLSWAGRHVVRRNTPPPFRL